MNILLIYPEFPETFWSFTHALSFIGKKAAFPPLGLVTVAALLPQKWNKRLVDINVESLIDKVNAHNPMEEKHFIEWIEIIDGDTSSIHYLKPGQSPEDFF